ncbi:Inhibitor of apoptosis-promoting Bax1 [Stieleria neptunia]|uniref:Inhibitor of apoptosis-promoting Bax1 n=1 Tax=Stieleria neptunia TaxID=2527979 RepID=A0A518HQL6_9BACT|nr:Bax inhibitor-1 family protein [Stieleria neptunia]QDV43132.1 Inhibitor of apoptosis-promoting Bax1 [Stieleria neptunia]
MSNVNPYSVTDVGVPAAFADESARAGFIRRTYTHLFGAILALIGIEAVIFTVVPQAKMMQLVQGVSPWTWLIALVLFMGIGWLARSWASNGASPAMQYAGLSLYVVAEAALLFPLLYVAITFVDPKTPLMAAAVTLVVFGGLTAFVFITGADFSGWGKFLALGGFAAMGAIFAGVLMGFSLGLWFSVAMVALASGYILYDTSNVLHHYRTDQHVAASLALFASVVLLFWYVLRILMAFAEE